MPLSWLFNGPTIAFLLKGFLLTLELAAVSIVLAFALGVLLALGRLSRHAVIRVPATTYIEGIRALPLLLIIFFCYFALPRMLNIHLEPFIAGVMALSAFNAAMVAEIVRAGILSVPRGIVEAAQAQGFAGGAVMRLIVLPIALRRMMPTLISQFVTLLKDTSLTAVITLLELTRSAQIVYSAPPFQPIPVFAFVALLYWAVNFSLSQAGRRLEAAA